MLLALVSHEVKGYNLVRCQIERSVVDVEKKAPVFGDKLQDCRNKVITAHCIRFDLYICYIEIVDFNSLRCQ